MCIRDRTERAADGRVIPFGDKFKLDPRIPALDSITAHGQKLVANSFLSRMWDKINASYKGFSIEDIEAEMANLPHLGSEELGPMADRIMDRVLREQLGLSDRDVVMMTLYAKRLMLGDLKPQKRRGVTHYDLGSILNHPEFPPRLKERLATGVYNWVGQNIVRPDQGDLPRYIDNTFLQMIAQFRSFGMAQVSKQLIPMVQRGFSGNVAAQASLLVTTLMGSLYSILQYALYNPEEAERDLRRQDGVAGVAGAMMHDAANIGGIISKRDKLKSPLGKIFLTGMAEPFLGPVGFGLDIAYPFLGIQDPSDWYEDEGYGGKGELAMQVGRGTAAYRFATDTVDPLKRAITGKSMDEEYAAQYAARLMGYGKLFNLGKYLIDQ